MKKFGWIIGGLIAITLVVSFIYRDLVTLMAFSTYVKPSTTFAETPAPQAPDYFNPQHWAALPDREDAADFTLEGFSDEQKDARMACFMSATSARMHMTTCRTWVKAIIT